MAQSDDVTIAQILKDLVAALPSGTQLHDALMSQIEPELTSENIHTLDEIYKDETEAERAERVERYKRAITLFEKAFADWSKNVDAKVDTFREVVLVHAEGESKAGDEQIMTNLESQLLSDDA